MRTGLGKDGVSSWYEAGVHSSLTYLAIGAGR